MNDINNIVFEVFNDLINMDYEKNIKLSFWQKIKKFFRYVISGYIFQVRKNRKLMNAKNVYQSEKCKQKNLKIAIYTVSTGKYDNIKEPIYVDSDIDYFVFTEQELPENSVWKKLSIPKQIEGLSSLEQARYLKIMPHLFFHDYDVSIFIDGNVRITCDIKPLIYSMIENNKVIASHKHQCRDCVYDEAKAIYAVGKAKLKPLSKQIKSYKEEGFPRHYGLFETNILIRRHNDDECKRIMGIWYDEIHKYTKRDQLSFTYSLWKNNFKEDFVYSLGNNSRLNPYFIVDSHR